MKLRPVFVAAAALLAALASLPAVHAAPAARSSHTLAPPRDVASFVQEQQVPSRVYGKPRRVWVYAPERFDVETQITYPLVVAFDGEAYRDSMGLPHALDSLTLAGALPPCVAVMVDDSEDRLGDLANHARFAKFLGDELLPWMQAHWHARRDPAHVLVTGSSAGGLAAAYAAFRRPDRFGIVLSQSGAFWRGNEGASEPWEWLTDQFARAPKSAVRFHLEVGDRETIHAVGRGPVFIEANRRLRDVLVRKGYPVTYVEVPGGVHAPETWAPRLPVALAEAAAPWRARPAAR